MADGARLSKWYVDVVADDGTALIGYVARLRWGLLRIAYESVLLSRPGAPTEVSLSLGPGALPVVDGDVISWRGRRPRLAARFERRAPALRRVLRDDAHLRVDWHCHMPAADAEVTLARGGGVLRGCGYVEELVIEGAAGRLGLDELRWGRFVAPGGRHAVWRHAVWIDGRGASPLVLAAVDGRIAVAETGSDAVTFPAEGLSLGLDEVRVLRSDQVGRGWFPGVGPLRRLLPRALDPHETKWLARGRLHRPGATTEATGFVIHEVVRWR